MTPSAPRPTREEEAHIEVGQTAITPGVTRALVGGFLALCCALPLFELSQVVRGDDAARTPWRRLERIPSDVETRTSGRSGTVQTLVAANRAILEGMHEFEDALEDEARIGQLLRPRAQAFLSGVLGAGNEQAYLGRAAGWLFFRRDVDAVTGRGLLDPTVLERRRRSGGEWTAPPQPDPREAILRFHRDLSAQGITLIVLPTPVKPTIQPGQLARAFARAEVAPVNADHPELLRQLREAGVKIVDPTDSLFATARAGSTQYLATDTHWRPEAAEAVAQLVADEVARIIAADAGAPRYTARVVDVTNRGDIFVMLDLPEQQSLVAAETVTIRQVRAEDGSPWRSAPDADVLVLGDSFSNIYSLESMGWGTGAGFVEHLSLALQRPVDRIVQNDAGAYATRELLQRAGAERLKGKKVVVWQFAARELVLGDWKVY